MPHCLQRFQDTGHSHFVTFSCRGRLPKFNDTRVYDLFPSCLETTRRRFEVCVYGYVVMPEHVHLLVSEPGKQTLADAIHYLKLSFSKRARKFQASPKDGRTCGTDLDGVFWEKRYHDRNVRDWHEFQLKLRYLHRNPVKRGLVRPPAEWKWSSFRHYAFCEKGVVEIESDWMAHNREREKLGLPPSVVLLPG